jgi:hypothetical protein
MNDKDGTVTDHRASTTTDDHAPTTDRSPVSGAKLEVVPEPPSAAEPDPEGPSPTAINLSVAVKHFTKDIRKAIEKNDFATPEGELADGAAAMLMQVFGRFAAHFSMIMGAPPHVFMATMQMLYEETTDTKPPSLALLR